VHAGFTEVQVQCDAAHRRLVEKLRMCKKLPKYWTVENRKECNFHMKVICVPGKHSRFMRIRNREQLSPAHCNELVKEPKTVFCGSFSFSVVASLMPIEGMMDLYKYIDVIERKAIPNMRKAFQDGGGKSQDIVPCLSSEKLKTIQEAKLNVIDWPGNSPDLNPIENL